MRGLERTAALSLGDVQEEVRHEEEASGPQPVVPPRVVGGARRSRTPVVVTAVALAVVVALGLLLSSTLRDGARTVTGADPKPSAGSAQEQSADIPDGWQTSSHDGWTVAVPPSYVESVFKESRQYKDPTSGRTMRVSTLTVGKKDAVADRRAQAASFAKSHDAYVEIGIGPADYRGYEAADWEFSYTSGGANLHALNRVFVVDGRGYSLFFQTRSTDDWSAARADFDKIAEAFQP